MWKAVEFPRLIDSVTASKLPPNSRLIGEWDFRGVSSVGKDHLAGRLLS